MLTEQLSSVLPVISYRLGRTVAHHRRVSSEFSTDQEHYELLLNQDSTNSSTRLFLKIRDQEVIKGEVEGLKRVKAYLMTPNLIDYELNGDNSWALYDFIEGEPIIQIVHRAEEQKTSDVTSLKMETEKEQMARRLRTSSGIITREEYLSRKASRLFSGRINGDRFSKFYSGTVMGEKMGKLITVNGNTFPLRPMEVFDEIRNKLKGTPDESRISYLSHCDLHHGNVMADESGELTVLDFEYADQVPPLMDLSKLSFLVLYSIIKRWYILASSTV